MNGDRYGKLYVLRSSRISPISTFRYQRSGSPLKKWIYRHRIYGLITTEYALQSHTKDTLGDFLTNTFKINSFLQTIFQVAIHIMNLAKFIIFAQLSQIAHARQATLLVSFPT